MRLACSQKDQFLPLFEKQVSILQLYKNLEKVPVRLRDCRVGIANMLAPSFKNLPESSSTPAALGLSIVVFIFKFFSLEVLLKQKLSEIVKLEQYLITDSKLYQSGGCGELNQERDFAKFENRFLRIFEIKRVSQVKVSFSSIALKLEITVSFGIPRDLRDSHNSLGLPIVSESFSSKNACFLAKSVLKNHILIFYIILYQYRVSIS